MEPVCHQCGATLREGAAFCFQCGAPQIRVSPPETPAGEAPSAASPIPTPADPASGSASPAAIPPTGSAASANAIAWPRALPVLLLAGFFMAITSLLPFAGALCCLWALAAGAATVGLYRWRVEQSVTTGMGARLGAAAGLAGFMLYALGFLGRLLIQGRQFREALRKGLQDAAARNPDPKAAEMVQWFASPEGLAALLTLILVMFLFAFLVFSTIGGAIGAALFGERESRQSRN